ncbi:HU family DNA-binding protein [Bacteroides congonensis]|jgi:predicted histone-like DNA-binding protein|uniref:HU family DNA-binding protein n=1 Tax=Bacteroides congonensis TaxID=1871006 RepID=UPI00189AF60A|nr:HU family DNA-binding protein [Bacteroides congonensis]
MAILFDWYEDPKPSDKEQGEKTLHPRLKYNGSIGTDLLRQRIQERCSLTATDVTAVLDALSHIMGQELADGKQVHLDGIGYFRPCLTSTEPVTIDTKRKATKVKLKSILFRADQTLKNEFGILKVKSLKGGLDFSQPTNEEIDRRLAKYFQTHQFMRRYDFQNLCGMARSTAMRHIRRLRDEGKLKNEGGVMQPIYVPGSGYYGNNEQITG